MKHETYFKLYKFMIHHFILTYNQFYKLNNKYRFKRLTQLGDIKYELYEEFRTQSMYHMARLTNIIGDSQRDSSSYINLYRMVHKEQIAKLPKLTQQHREIINNFTNQRNWSLHFSKFEFMSENDLNKEYFKHPIVHDYNTKYVTRELYADLIYHNWNEINKTKIILDLAVRDYELLSQNNIQI